MRIPAAPVMLPPIAPGQFAGAATPDAFTHEHTTGGVHDAMTVRDRGGQEFNADTYDSLQNAVDACIAAGGGKVLSVNRDDEIESLVVAAQPLGDADIFVHLEGRNATIRQAVMDAGDGRPIIASRIARLLVTGFMIDGQRTSQPADGFSDTFENGDENEGTGRAYRAAVKADASIYADIVTLVVRDCDFVNTFGAAVATRDVPYVSILGGSAEDCNFEMGYIYGSDTVTTTQMAVVIEGTRITNIGTSDGSVNANGFVTRAYPYTRFTHNICDTVERDHVKVEGCDQAIVTDNISDAITADNFAAIQFQLTANRIVVSRNNIKNAGQGIAFNQTGTCQSVVCTDNVIDTTTGTTLGDAIIVGLGPIEDCIISGNVGRNIKRHGINLNTGGNRIRITDNLMRGQATAASLGIVVNAATANVDKLEVHDNQMSNFHQNTGNDGVFALRRASSWAYTWVSIKNNHIDAGSSANRAIRLLADMITAGVFAGNYCNGSVDIPSAGLIWQEGNIVTGSLLNAPYSVARSTRRFYASKAWNPGSLADGASETTTVTLTGTLTTDGIEAVNFSLASAIGWDIKASVTAADTVTVELTNNTGGVLDLGSGTLWVSVLRHT